MPWAWPWRRSCASAARTRRLRVSAALITRPEPEASRWVAALQAQGVAAEAFALITIGPAPDPARLQHLRQHLHRYRALMFVSGNAVRYFFDQNTALALTGQALAATNLIAIPRLWAPGPGTARALEALGIAPSRIDQPAAHASQFDSESLWQQVGASLRPGDRVLIVRGSDAGQTQTQGSGREWLSGQIQQAGAAVDFIAAYTRMAPAFTPQALERARDAAHTGRPWLLSSAQALGFLTVALPGQDWSRACAVATHPRIAQAASAAGFGTVLDCRPALDDVARTLASIESRP